MGIREKINDNPMIAGSAVGAVILIAVIVILLQLKSMMCRPKETLFGDAWFTTVQDKTTFTKDDEGKLFFSDKSTRLAPFNKDGKEAVRVYLYTCGDDNTLRVAYLERYTKEAQTIIDKANANTGDELKPGVPMRMDIADVQMNGRELKKPGKEWVSRTKNPQAWDQVEQLEPCPEGKEWKPYMPSN